MASSGANNDHAADGSASNGQIQGVQPQIPASIPERRKVALITGITGQDGSYLTEFLLGKGYEVHGLIRRSSNFNTARLDHLYVDPHNAAKARMKLHYADLSDGSFLCHWVDVLLPDEVYNFVAASAFRHGRHVLPNLNFLWHARFLLFSCFSPSLGMAHLLSLYLSYNGPALLFFVPQINRQQYAPLSLSPSSPPLDQLSSLPSSPSHVRLHHRCHLQHQHSHLPLFFR